MVNYICFTPNGCRIRRTGSQRCSSGFFILVAALRSFYAQIFPKNEKMPQDIAIVSAHIRKIPKPDSVQIGIAADLPSGTFSEKNLDHVAFFDFLLASGESYEHIPSNRLNFSS
jgi:hypothetical protein